ncbi:WecB/TagA/CpsF family glycosyltransferase, partial [Streptomyces sp. NPDC088921]|uniref:WecB/TagA/CpsF family glycosyltransferase n=1 Tax=Streptomyces sp. NPDC088921 TaxID=3155062 RepID=UPI003449064F
MFTIDAAAPVIVRLTTVIVADAIARSGAQMLFLGMTSPKKEIFTAAYGKRTGARLVHGVGGSFDILAGVTRRAPVSWQRWGVEWLYRALQEPRRLGRRYLTTNPAFVLMTARE